MTQATRGANRRSERVWERRPDAAAGIVWRPEQKAGPSYRQTRMDSMRAWAEIAKALAASADPADRKLSASIVAYVWQTPAVRAMQKERLGHVQAQLSGVAVAVKRTAEPTRPTPSRGPDMTR